MTNTNKSLATTDQEFAQSFGQSRRRHKDPETMFLEPRTDIGNHAWIRSCGVKSVMHVLGSRLVEKVELKCYEQSEQKLKKV